MVLNNIIGYEHHGAIMQIQKPKTRWTLGYWIIHNEAVIPKVPLIRNIKAWQLQRSNLNKKQIGGITLSIKLLNCLLSLRSG